ncbi:MAG: hypothetical protein AABW52_00045 [Nanoarchaeota archaeon]
MKMELGYNRKKAGEFYEAGYKLTDENSVMSDELKITDNRKRHFIIFNF